MYNYNPYFNKNQSAEYFMQGNISFAFMLQWIDEPHANADTPDYDEVMSFSL